MTKKYEMDMTEGPILKKLIVFALPLMFSNILQLLFNAADIIIVGKFAGSLSLAAVGSTSSLVNLLVNFFIGISIGTNVLVAKYFGSKQHSDLSNCVHTSVALSAILGVVIGLIGLFLSTPLLKMMNTDAQVLPLASLYLKIYFLGVPANVVYNFAAAILRAIGDTDRPLKFLTISGVVNVVLNLITVVGLHMNVAGVAIATAISQYVAATLVVLCLMHAEGAYRLALGKLRLHKDTLTNILRLGFPAGLQSTLFSVSNVIVQSSVNSFGAVVMAGNSAASNLEGFVHTACVSLYHSSLSFTSQNVGAKRYDRLNKIIASSAMLVVVLAATLGMLVYMLKSPLLSLYVSKADPNRDGVLASATLRLGYVCTFYALCGLMDVGCGTLRGLGKPWAPMIISTLGACGFRILWVTTVFRAFHSLPVLYIGYPISWILTAFAHFTAYFIARKKIILPEKES